MKRGLDAYGYSDRQSDDEGTGTLKRPGRREYHGSSGIESTVMGRRRGRVQPTVVDAAITIVVVKVEP